MVNDVAQVKTSHYSIFNYWRNKWIYQDGKITEGVSPMRNVPCELIIEDWGEPCCWACGRVAGKLHREREYETWLHSEEGYKKIWNNKTVAHDLNRCHIVPNVLEGEDAPYNLFLMCPECHTLSPDTDNKESFFRWVYKRRKGMNMGKMNLQTAIMQINDELINQGFPAIDGIAALCNINISSERLQNATDYRALLQYLKAHAGTHGPAIQDSTMIYCITDWFKTIYEMANNQSAG